MKDISKLKEKIQAVVNQKGRCIISIDGRCGSGKTTLARTLQEEMDCDVIHMDDFFLRKEQRTPERYATPGENVDHERFLEEVLIPLHEGKTVSFHPYDPTVMDLSKTVRTAGEKPIIVIEGSYSQRDDLRAYYDLTVFLTIEKEAQLERIEKRDPEKLTAFIEKWIPLEEMYFEKYDVENRADLVLYAEK